MSSPIHAVIVETLEAHPEALAYLLELHGKAPEGPLIPTTGTRTKTFTLERRVDRAYLVTIDRLPNPLAAEQLDDILGMVADALRAHLEDRIVEHREYKSELFRGIYNKGKAEGEAKAKAKAKAEGKAKGKAEVILAVLAARGIPVSDAIRDRILACTDIATLDAWIQRAAVVSSAAAVARSRTPPRPPAKHPARRAQKG